MTKGVQILEVFAAAADHRDAVDCVDDEGFPALEKLEHSVVLEVSGTRSTLLFDFDDVTGPHGLLPMLMALHSTSNISAGPSTPSPKKNIIIPIIKDGYKRANVKGTSMKSLILALTISNFLLMLQNNYLRVQSI